MSKILMALTTAIVVALAIPGVALAAGDEQASKAVGADVGAAGAAEFTDGEVRKIDKQSGKLTLKHGAIKNLDMPGMTMVFTVKDKAMLDNVQPGDKVRFKAISKGGTLIVTEMQTPR